MAASPARHQGTVRLFVGLALWALLIAAGFVVLAMHQMAPGEAAAPPAAIVSAARTKPKLLLFAHPKCPCTRATIEELDRLMTSCRGQLEVQVFIFNPADKSDSWSDGSVLKRSREIEGVTILLDEGGKEAARYGVRTSGQTILYSASGQLVFSGGITSSRGHEGDNAGRDAITSFVQTGRSPTKTTPVYGCSLQPLP